MSYAMTKEIQFDAGHRVPQHESKCKNPHGHRYRVEACVKAHDLIDVGPAEGMVLDFGDVKTILTEHVHDVLDHGFIVYEEDEDLLLAFGYQYDPDTGTWQHFSPPPKWKIIIFPYVPTAESLAQWVFEQIEDPIRNAYNEHAYLEYVRVWETPTSTAVYMGAYTDANT